MATTDDPIVVLNLFLQRRFFYSTCYDGFERKVKVHTSKEGCGRVLGVNYKSFHRANKEKISLKRATVAKKDAVLDIKPKSFRTNKTGLVIAIEVEIWTGQDGLLWHPVQLDGKSCL